MPRSADDGINGLLFCGESAESSDLPALGRPVSEYQYYEFVSVDQPLSAKQQDELRAVSTRGRISSSSFVNDYQWGDLKADPRRWMERYFDAHLYLTNWGTHRIALRMPKAALDPAIAAPYCVGNAATSWTTRTHLIVDLHSQDEEGIEDWVDPEGRLAAIIPIRTELAEGDLRPLYLAWLLVVQERALADDEPEPPVPPGLGELSGPQTALADFLRLDPDLLAAAAEASEPLTTVAPSAAALRRWVQALAVADKDQLLLRVLRGEGAMLRSELLRSFHGNDGDRTAKGSRTAGQLLAAGETAWAKRQEAQRKRDAADGKRREWEAAAARAKRVQALASNPAKAWKQVDSLIETKKPKEYDAAVTILLDLQALDPAAFATQMGRLRAQHARKPSLIDRFDRARFP